MWIEFDVVKKGEKFFLDNENYFLTVEEPLSSKFKLECKKYSKIWHGIGWLLRFQIAILIAYSIYLEYGFNWILILKWELLYLAVASIGYDLIINIVRYIAVGSPPIFYIDNKGINI